MPKSKTNRSVLVVLDGWGLYKDYEGNAITRANTPNWNRIWQDYPTAVLEASGEAVGLPDGQMGNSEVGHFTIGAGRIYFQDLARINRAINDNSFYENPAFKEAFDHVKKHHSTLHLLGLVSNGGVHSHQDHIKALVKAAKMNDVDSVNIHAFLDGRDTPPQSAPEFIQKLESDLEEVGLGKIVALSGRFYAMDRDKKWDRIDAYFEMVTGKKTAEVFSSAQAAIRASYNNKINDEHLIPCLIEAGPGVEATIKPNDAVIFFNFRNDRMLQICDRFQKTEIENLCLVSMSEYSEHFGFPVAFTKEKPTTYMGKEISDAGLKQLRITETEKSAHMTFFLNCQNEGVLEGEDRMILESNNVISHAEKPEMRAADITAQMVQAMENHTYDAIFANICNGDMVGHCGDIPAGIKACEAVDACLAELEKAALKYDYDLVIIADHGNIEILKNEETGEPHTAHTTNPVPFIVISNRIKTLPSREGGLVDIAPTILDLIGLEVPHEMGGHSLVS